MSGQSGGIGPSVDEEESCGELKIQTHLSSPNPEVIDNLNNGDTLNIRLGGQTGPIELITNDGDVAGSLVSGRQMKLIECINDGHKYIAEIMEIEEGNCEILIRSSE